MSGGAYNYAFERIAEFARDMGIHEYRTRGDSAVTWSPERAAFRTHLALVAGAMKAIEWVDSGDSSSPEDTDAIRRALGPSLTALTLEALDEEHKRLGEDIERLKASLRPTEAPKEDR